MSSDNIFGKQYLNEVNGGNNVSSENTNTPNPFPAEPDLFGMKTDTYCMLIHLSQLLGLVSAGVPLVGLIVSIVLWAIAKDRSPLVDQHGKIVLNWSISLLIYIVVAAITIIGLLIVPILIVLGLVFPIIGAVKANEGVVWKYPLSIAFFK